MRVDTGTMARTAFPAAIIAALALLPAPAPAQDGCRLCYSSPAATPGERPLSIEIFADLSMGKLAMTGRGGGSVTVDPDSSGKRTQGDMLDLGGSTITGRGLIRGEPLRDVRVDLPDRVPMSAPDGSEAELTGFTTNLPAHPVLDSNGRLEFTFGAKLVVRGSRGGNYRGRIPISVDYN